MSVLRSSVPTLGLSPRQAALLDLTSQQAAWWSAVLMVRAGLRDSAALPSLAVVWLAVWLRGRATLRLALLAGALGLAVDTTLLHLHAISFPADPNAQLGAAWMVGLWCAFGTGFTASLAWLGEIGGLAAAAIGGASGLFAYRAGASLGVLSLGTAPASWLAIAVGWAAAVSTLRLAARELARRRST